MTAAEIPLDPADLPEITDTVCGKVKGANLDDAAEAVSVALLEWIEKGDDLDLDLSRSVNGALVTRAVWRLKTALSRREAHNTSLDAFLEKDEDRAPVELAVDEVDFDSHLKLRELSDNATTRAKLEAVRAGGTAEVRPRGAACHRSRWPDDVVEHIRTMRAIGTQYPTIAEATGVPQKTLEKWCRRERRLTTTPGWTRELMIAAIKDFQREEGRRPSTKDVQNDPRLPCMETIRGVFGRWSLALEAAGIVIEGEWEVGRGQERRWPDERVAAAIRDFVERQGRMPRQGDYRSALGLPGRRFLHRRYGTQRADRILEIAEASSG